jgi:SAM-dependent methyltransferase
MYGSAVKKESCCCSGKTKGVVAQSAGYSKEELEALPKDAVSNSFGCGNPVAFSGVREGDVVLDLGAGAGIDVILAAKKVGPKGKSIGIDMTDEMLTRARKNIQDAGLSNAEVRKGLIEDLPVDSSSVNWVISNCVINLSPEKPKVFSEIFRVLKPGGKMVVSDIVAEGLPEWVKKNDALYASCISGAISESSYVAGLKEAGFTTVEIQDRLVYDSSQIHALLLSELTQIAADKKGTSPEDQEAFVRKTAKSLEGKVWSARIYAEKNPHAA